MPLQRRQPGPELEWHSVDSSRMDWVAYDFDNRNVHVVFRDGTPWVYYAVPYEVWRRFLRSASKGKFINRVLNDFSYGPSVERP